MLNLKGCSSFEGFLQIPAPYQHHSAKQTVNYHFFHSWKGMTCLLDDWVKTQSHQINGDVIISDQRPTWCQKRTFIQTNPNILPTLLKQHTPVMGGNPSRGLSLLIYLDPPVANNSGNFKHLVVSLRSPPTKGQIPKHPGPPPEVGGMTGPPKKHGLNLRFGIWMSREDGPNKNTEPSSRWSDTWFP